MSERLSEGLEKALMVLDVPVAIIEELYEQFGERVWWQVVRNVRAELAGGYCTRMILSNSDPEDAGMGMLLHGLAREVPGASREIALTAEPAWLVWWGMRRGIFNREEQAMLVARARGRALLWYLGHVAVLDEGSHRAARQRCRWGRGSSYRYGLEKNTWEIEVLDVTNAELLLSVHRSTPLDYGEVGGEWDLALVAERGRELLGDGSSEESVAGWRRLFDLVAAGVQADLAEMVDVAYRITGEIV